MLLTLALQVAAMPRIRTNVEEEAGKDAKVAESPKDYLEEVTNEDVREFWKKNFQQVRSCSGFSLMTFYSAALTVLPVRIFLYLILRFCLPSANGQTRI